MLFSYFPLILRGVYSNRQNMPIESDYVHFTRLRDNADIVPRRA